MSDTPQEPKDLVLAQLQALREDIKGFREEAHRDMLQVKQRLSAVERQVANLGETVVAQWENFDNHENRLHKLETE